MEKNIANLKVLIVEDDDLLANQVKREVTSLGWEFVIVGTVRAARAKFAKVAFDLVILDRMLDDSEDGLALIRWFNELETKAPGILVASRLGATHDHILARDVLWRSVWESYKSLPPQETVINTALSRLRGNLSVLPDAPLIINNRLGYRLTLKKADNQE